MMMDNHRVCRAPSGKFCRMNALQIGRHKSAVTELSNLNILEVAGGDFQGPISPLCFTE